MEQQVKLFVEGEQKQYFQKAQEKDAAHQVQIEELEQKSAQKDQLLSMQKAHADSIMREVMQITQKEKEFEIEIKNLKEQLRVSDATKQETQSQLIMCQDQLKEMQTIMIE